MKITRTKGAAADGDAFGQQRLRALPQNQFRGAATDVDHQSFALRAGNRVSHAGVYQPGFFMPGDHIDAKPQMPFCAGEEQLSIVGFTHGAGCHRTHATGLKAAQLFAAFAPGPLTILLEKKEIIPDLVTSGLPRVAVRVPNHPMTLDLLRGLDFPLAAPSANPFGYISPTTAQHVADQLGGKIPYILDGGACSVGVESTIVGWEHGQVTVYRLGGMAVEDITNIVGRVEVQLNQSSNPAAPGMLKSHYAPRKPLLLDRVAENLEQYRTQRIGFIAFDQMRVHPAIQQQIVLAPDGETRTAAQHLFAALRTLDNADIDLIIAETMPDSGLGKAINDRLRRAAATEL